MSILNTIIDTKRAEVARSKSRLPPSELQALLKNAPPPRDFRAALTAPAGARIIAEVKRASPSAGVLDRDASPVAWQPTALAQAYERGGAAALSVLTDVRYFWGHADALPACRAATNLPVLRKDFILESYQVDESRWLGADAVLLIARALDVATLVACAERATALGMAVLLEVHEAAELDKALAVPNAIVGVNNRDLATLKVDIGQAARLKAMLPPDRLVVAESGLSAPAHIATLLGQGIRAFLIGEHLARHRDPAAELARLRRGDGEPCAQVG